MKKKIISGGLMAFALMLGFPVGPSEAQCNESLYVTPKIIYSYQNGDMSATKWQGGSILSKDKKDDRFGFGLAVGTDLSYSTSYPIRVELEYAYHGSSEFGNGPKTYVVGPNWHQASQKFEIKAHSLMGNAFYDFNTNSAFTPYVGGGLGVAYLDTKYRTDANLRGNAGSAALSNNDWNLAWNVGGGFAYYLKDGLALDVGYRYVDLGTGEPGSFKYPNLGYSGKPKVDVTSHEFSVGFRFSGF